jgi:hypothetical protein
MLSKKTHSAEFIVHETAQAQLLDCLCSSISALRSKAAAQLAEQAGSVDGLERQVCSLLRTLLKIALAADLQGKHDAELHLLIVQHATFSNNLLWTAGGDMASAGDSKGAATNSRQSSSDDNSTGGSSTGGSSGACSGWRLPFLQLTAMGFMVSAGGLRSYLHELDSVTSSDDDSSCTIDQHQQQDLSTNSEGSISGKWLATTVWQCLQDVHKVGKQLEQQAVLPGDEHKAAAAMHKLQRQQQQVQQALKHAMQQLQNSAEAASVTPNCSMPILQLLASQHAEQQQQQQQQPEFSMAVAAVADNARHGDQLLVSEQLDDLYPSVLQEWQLTQAVAADVVGSELLQQLQAACKRFGEALWLQLPQPHCCNNWACTNVEGMCEAKLCREISRCSSCKVARWVGDMQGKCRPAT